MCIGSNSMVMMLCQLVLLITIALSYSLLLGYSFLDSFYSREFSIQFNYELRLNTSCPFMADLCPLACLCVYYLVMANIFHSSTPLI